MIGILYHNELNLRASGGHTLCHKSLDVMVLTFIWELGSIGSGGSKLNRLNIVVDSLTILVCDGNERVISGFLGKGATHSVRAVVGESGMRAYLHP